MERREFISRMAALLGCSALSLDLKAIDAALSFDGSTGADSSLHSQLVSRIADIIIPETETPSASQAGVPSYINFYLTEFMPEASAHNFVDGLVEMSGQDDFLSLDTEQQLEIVQSLDDALHTEAENPVYKQLKELIVIGYYTSQIGATQALRYDPVPGPYKEMKLAEVGRTWL